MDTILKMIIEMDPTQLTNYINCFLVGIGVFALIGFIIGCFRGVYRASSMLLCIGGCFVAIIFLAPEITKVAYNTNLTSYGSITLPEGVTTAGEYVKYYIQDFCQSNQIDITITKEMYDSIESIAFCFINIAVYISLVLLAIFIVGPLLHIIIYNLLFRLIIPKRARKKHKLRLVGGLITAIEFTLSITIFLSPLTALVNTTLAANRDEGGKITKKEIDNDYYNAVMKLLDSYNNSVVAQVFFAISLENGQSFDVSLMNQATHTTITNNGKKTDIKIYTELGSLSQLGIEALSTGAIDDQTKINYNLLLAPAFVNTALEYVGNSVLLQTIASLGATLATNMESVKKNIDLTSIDWYAIDWKDTSTALSDVYSALYDTGAITMAIDGKDITKELYIDSTNVDNFKTAFTRLGNNDLVSTVLPKVITSYAHNFNISNQKKTLGKYREDNETSGTSINLFKDVMLPEEESFYQDIAWGDELAKLINVFYGLSQQYYAYSNNHLTISEMSNAFGSNPLNFLFGIDTVQDDSLTVEQKYEQNKFVNGGTYENTVEGQIVSYDVPGIKEILGITSTSTEGLFDLSVIKKFIEGTDVLDKVVSNLDLSSMIKTEKESSSIGNATKNIANIVKDWGISDWKLELNGLCDAILPALDIVNIVSKEGANINEFFSCGDQVEYLFGTVDNSRVMKEILPDLLNDLMSDTIKLNDKEIKPNFQNIENWGLEGHYFASMLKSIGDVIGQGSFDNVDWLNVDDISQEQYDQAVLDGFEGTFDNYYLENSRINSLLTNLYATQCIGGKYVGNDRVDGVFVTMLKEIIKTALQGVDEKLDIDTIPEKDIIDLDFNLGNGNVLFDVVDGTNIYISWISANKAYNGEIGNISLLVGKAGAFMKTSQEMSSLTDLLDPLNNSYILRNIISIIINDKIGDIQLDGVAKDFLDRADFDVFHKKDLSLNPYVIDEGILSLTNDSLLSNRKDEIFARKQELDSIKTIYDMLDEVQEILDLDSTSDPFITVKKLVANKNLTTSLADEDPIKNANEKSVLERVLSALKKSKIFNSPVYDDESNRVGTTAFEYLFQYITSGETMPVTNFLKDLSKPENVHLLYDLTSDGAWDEEIVNFNASLYGIATNDLLDVIKDSSDLLKDTNDLLGAGKTPLQDLFADMHNSRILDDSIAFALDNQFLPKIIEQVGTSADKYYISSDLYESIEKRFNDLTDVEVKAKLELYGASSSCSNLALVDKMGAFWKNEGQSLEEVIVGVNKFDFNNINMDDDSISIGEITDPLRHSLCLNYLNEDDGDALKISSQTEKKECSIYQIATIKAVDISLDSVRDQLVPSGQTDYTTTDDIVSYDEELDNVKVLFSRFKFIKELITKNADTITNEEVDQLDNDFIKIIQKSHVYNYTKYGVKHKTASDLSNEHSYFERMVMKLDDTLISALKGALGLTDEQVSYSSSEELATSTKVIDSDNNALSRKEDAYVYEYSLLLRVIKQYIASKEVIDLIKSNDIVGNLTDERIDLIKGLFNLLKESAVLNYTDYSSYKTSEVDSTYHTHSDNSLYQHIVIYLINTLNGQLESNITLDVSESTTKRIRNYSGEIDVIFNVIKAYQDISSFLVSGDIEITTSNVNQLVIAAKKFLVALEPSDVYHYVRKASWNNRPDDKLTVFEQIIQKMLDSASLSDSIYNSKNPSHAVLGSGSAVIKNKIIQISENENKPTLNQDPSLFWLKEGCEIDCIIELVKSFNSINFDSALDDLSDYISYDGVKYSGIIADVNSSYVLHDIVSTMAHEFTVKSKIDDDSHLIDEVGYAGMLINPTSKIGYYKIDDSAINFDEKVTLWNQEAYRLSTITDLVNKISSSASITNLKDIKPFETLLPTLASTKMFEDVIGEVFITLLHEEAKISISGYTASLSYFLMDDVLSDNKATLFEAQNNRFASKYGVNADWAIEGEGLDEFVSGIQDYIENKYAPYITNTLILGIPQEYPEWGTLISEGVTLAVMTTTSHLQNVLAA